MCACLEINYLPHILSMQLRGQLDVLKIGYLKNFTLTETYLKSKILTSGTRFGRLQDVLKLVVNMDNLLCV